ncbi:hypothetical protein PCASD_16393 [Puccinia coronata f. sp. avenae]|uniref:Uncharacterized protein n=2 Tax=Puccinia coronata f. sp. avenae TaxID=200324 RepID=A0A2N5SUK2_9BASI|nr:hypothetical protein PCASD_16393 [Puccinia coronata f. sp. avenae]
MVLSLAPFPDFICNILFVLFFPEKNKEGTTTCVPVKSKPDLSMVFNSRNHYTLADFQSASPTIDWSAYILKHHDWPKGSPKLITLNGSFAIWLGDIDAGTQTKGGIIILMNNPKDKGPAMPAPSRDLPAAEIDEE